MTTIVQRSCRYNIRMSRQQLYREDVATTLGCRNNIRLSRQQLQGPECRDVDKLSRRQKRSRQEQAVATPPSLKTCRNNTETPATRTATRPATRTATRPATRTDVAMRALYVATISVYWASLLKSRKKCIEIRAQLQNPINMQLQKKKRNWVVT